MYKFLEKARGTGFWGLDYLKGQRVKKHYEDIKFILENENSAESINRRKNYLDAIIHHALTTVPYYTGMKKRGLEDFPIINKNIIRDNIDSFISSKFKKEELLSGHTSGSTGTPFKFYKDKNKKLRNDADFLYFYEKGDYTIGKRLYYLRVWNSLNKKNSLAVFAKNLVMQDTANLSNSNVNLFINTLLNDKADKFILAYASSIETICSNASQINPSVLNVKAVFTSSEVLTDPVRDKVSRFFDCPVYSRYSNQENGLLAQQCSMETSAFQVNTASYIMEVLEFDSDKNVKPGERGRVVITDLFNYGMPMIRYDTGDIAVLSENYNDRGHVALLHSIEGRKVDFIYDTSGNLLSPYTIVNTMWNYADEIKQFQFIQNNANKYYMKVNCNSEIPAYREMIISDLKQYLGMDAQIEIESVHGIPLLESGKRKKVVNNYRK